MVLVLHMLSLFQHLFGTLCSRFKYIYSMQEKPSTEKQKKALLVFICIPVSPGHSRIIFASPRNFATWADRIIPRWIFHLGQNLILDSDLYLLHVEVIHFLYCIFSISVLFLLNFSSSFKSL